MGRAFRWLVPHPFLTLILVVVWTLLQNQVSAGMVVFGLILGIIGVYFMLSREGISDTTFIDYANSPFQETDVVGMHRQHVLSNADIPTRYRYQLPDRFGFCCLDELVDFLNHFGFRASLAIQSILLEQS